MKRWFVFILLVLSSTAAVAETIPTRITVRAVSRDAKVIGDGVGGARITIRDLDRGKILARGIQRGSTGDTARIMKQPRERGAVVYGTEGAAAFHAELRLDRPTRVEIVAEGPLGYPQAIQRASKTMLLVPGGHIEGEGVLLEIHGFIVDIAPLREFSAGERPIVRTRVTMSCGCPTEPGGMWNADAIAIVARLRRGKRVVAEAPMRYAGETSTYEVAFDPLRPGSYDIEIVASDPSTANFGRATTRIRVRAR